MSEYRRTFVIPLGVGLLFLLSSPSVGATDHEESLLAQKACGMSGVPCSNKAFEGKQIDRFSDKVCRNNGVLQLKLASGSLVTLTNSNDDNERLKLYWFITYFEQNEYFLVQARGWEGFDYLMINAFNGQILHLSGIPIISRDRERFVVTSLDLEAGFRPNRISIFRFEDGGIIQEWSKDYTASGPSDAIWINNTAITYFENISIHGGQTLHKKPVHLKLKKGEWKILMKVPSEYK